MFDLFHIGHINILRNAKAICDKLVVGVSTDDLVEYKHKKAVIPFSERVEVVRACQYVDCVIPQHDRDKFAAWKKLKFNILVVGDDWYKDELWEGLEKQFNSVGVRVMYFPYTKGTSSTLINETLLSLREEE